MTNCLTTRDRTLLIRTPILPQATEAWKQHQQALVSLIYPALPSTLRRQEHQDDYTIARRSAYGPYHLIDDTGIPYDRAVPIDQMKVVRRAPSVAMHLLRRRHPVARPRLRLLRRQQQLQLRLHLSLPRRRPFHRRLALLPRCHQHQHRLRMSKAR